MRTTPAGRAARSPLPARAPGLRAVWAPPPLPLPAGIGPVPDGLEQLRVLVARRLATQRAADSAIPAPRTGGGTRRTRPVAAAEGPGGDDGLEQVAALVARAQSGDATAFGELYDRNVDTVYRYVYYRVGSVALAEDLVSETFLRALRRLDTFTFQGRDVAAWFITIARNLIADHYKSSRYRLELATEDLVGAGADRAAADDPESQVLEQLTSRALVDAVKELGAEQQECIVLRFLQGLSLAETAEAMGKNEGAIKALQYRAVKALARRLPPGTVL